MSDGFIPVDNLPLEQVTLDDSLVYNVTLEKSTLAKVDKAGDPFCNLQLQVVDGDYEGKTVMMNYLPLPIAVADTATKAVRIKAQDKSANFARFCKSFGIREPMPVVDMADADSKQRWQDWIAKFYGNTGKITIRNQEFPEGTGKLRSGVNDFVF